MEASSHMLPKNMCNTLEREGRRGEAFWFLSGGLFGRRMFKSVTNYPVSDPSWLLPLKMTNLWDDGMKVKCET